MTPGSIVFDLDGTLTDSRPGLFASLRHMHDDMGWQQPDDAELLTWLGPPTVTTLEDAGHPPEVVDRAMRAFRERLATGLTESTLYPGIEAMLHALHAGGARLAVATFKVQADADAVIDHYGLRTLFCGVHGRRADELGHSKAPVIARALASAGARASEAFSAREVVMVGDRLHDIASAKELGVPTIGVAYGYGGRGELAAAGAERIVDSVAELCDALGV